MKPDSAKSVREQLHKPGWFRYHMVCTALCPTRWGAYIKHNLRLDTSAPLLRRVLFLVHNLTTALCLIP